MNGLVLWMIQSIRLQGTVKDWQYTDCYSTRTKVVGGSYNSTKKTRMLPWTLRDEEALMYHKISTSYLQNLPVILSTVRPLSLKMSYETILSEFPWPKLFEWLL